MEPELLYYTISGPKMAHLPKYFRKTNKIIFMYLFAPFTMQNFKKILRVDPGNPIFRSKMAHLPYMRIFFRKTINITSMYFLVPFIVQKFKKIFRADIKLWGYTIFWPKMGHLPQIRIFSKKPLIQFPCSWWFFSLCKISKVSFQ